MIGRYMWICSYNHCRLKATRPSWCRSWEANICERFCTFVLLSLNFKWYVEGVSIWISLFADMFFWDCLCRQIVDPTPMAVRCIPYLAGKLWKKRIAVSCVVSWSDLERLENLDWFCWCSFRQLCAVQRLGDKHYFLYCGISWYHQWVQAVNLHCYFYCCVSCVVSIILALTLSLIFEQMSLPSFQIKDFIPFQWL